jgi:hypothetical protein
MFDHVPAGQLRHVADELAMLALEYFPAAQGVQKGEKADAPSVVE